MQRVLVIDHDRIVLESVAKSLEAEGFQTRLTEGGWISG